MLLVCLLNRMLYRLTLYGGQRVSRAEIIES